MTGESRAGRLFRALLRWGVRIVAAVIIVAVVVFLYIFHTALYHRFYLFPREAAAWHALREARQKVTLDDGWTEYRGACHSHSVISHDCVVTFPEILAAAKQADINFIFMTDHCPGGKADYSIQWKGLHDGILFVRGFEMDYGFMPWGLPDNTVLYNSTEPHLLAKQIEKAGGKLFFAHSEEPRIWDLPQLKGMEIYNIHTNLLTKYKYRHRNAYADLGPDIILSLGKYGDEVMRLIYEPQTKILAHWDQLNRTRKIVGIAGNDCHQNNGICGYYTEDGYFQLHSTGPDGIAEWKLNPVTRLLLRLCFGKLTPGRQLFRFDLDPYQRSLRFVNTHILAKALTEKDLLDGLVQGRVFIAFDMIADARGFTYLAQGGGHKVVMGQTIALTPDLGLEVASPEPCRFDLIRDGNLVERQKGREFHYKVKQPGKYRIEADVYVVDKWVPWVYTNPIEVTAASGAALSV